MDIYSTRDFLKAPSSVNVALKSLLNKELLYKTSKGYIVYDRFMGKWLKSEVIWSLFIYWEFKDTMTMVFLAGT